MMLRTMFSLIALVTVAGVCVAADDALVAHYSFEEGPGGVVRDASGNGNDGRIVGEVSYVELPGDRGRALRFGSGNAYVDCGSRPSLALKDAVTVELWLYAETAPNSGTEAGLIGTGLGGYALTAVTGGCWWYVNGRADGGEATRLDVSGGGMRADASWRHMAATFDGRTAQVYVDGELTGTRAFDEQRTINAAGPLYLRYPLLYGTDQELPFVCMFDDVRVYKRALSAAELRRHYRKDRNWRQGRSVTAGQLNVTERHYPSQSKLRAVVDFAGLAPLPDGAKLTLELSDVSTGKVIDRHDTSDLPSTDRWVAIFETNERPAGDYLLTATARDKSGTTLGEIATTPLTLPGPRPPRPEPGPGTRPLNNLVTELLNVSRSQEAEHHQYPFTNPRKGWVFISSRAAVDRGGEVRLIVDAPRREDPVLVHRPGEPQTLEAMHHLSAGKHTLDVYSDAGRLNSLIVRAIPELLYAEIGYRPSTFLPGLGPYTSPFKVT